MSASIYPEHVVPPSSSSGSLPSWRSSVTFNMRVDQDDQEVALAGMLRPFVGDQMRAIRGTLETAAKNATGELCLDFKRLKYMNNVAFLEINRFVRWAVEARPNLKIRLIISSVIPWAIRKFQVIAELYPNVSVVIYDKAFYPLQQVIEDDDFIVVLLTQAKIIWEHERLILERHGLQPGMRIADIGCGLGEFSLKLQNYFKPEYIVGVDHSRPMLRYAQKVVKNLGIENVEYQYGDAAALLLPDNSYDFVSCRLSLQVFDQPKRILNELFRICKPGGRIYVTNEMMSCIAGYPQQEAIRWTYDEIIKMGRKLGMDMDIGFKTREMLVESELEDVKVDLVNITNMNTDRHDFAKVVESWSYVINQMAQRTEADAETQERLKVGHAAHVEAILSERGFASWPIYAGSGRKPLRCT
jgi:ubiquinone/menaquinone biosynthesis C-methylase UbiE